MAKTINIMEGVSQKDQWLFAVNAYDIALRVNVVNVMSDLEMFGIDEADSWNDNLEAALRVLDSYTEDMKRLVEGVFDGQE